MATMNDPLTRDKRLAEARRKREEFKLIGSALASTMLGPGKCFAIGFFMGLGFMAAMAVPMLLYAFFSAA